MPASVSQTPIPVPDGTNNVSVLAALREALIALTNTSAGRSSSAGTVNASSSAAKPSQFVVTNQIITPVTYPTSDGKSVTIPQLSGLTLANPTTNESWSWNAPSSLFSGGSVGAAASSVPTPIPTPTPTPGTGPIAYPENFGAVGKPGVDDTVAINAWIAYAAAGGNCWLQGKTYLCNGTVVIDGQGSALLGNNCNFTLHGCGPTSVIQLMGSPGLTIESLSGTGVFKCVDMQFYSPLRTNTLVHTNYLVGLTNFDSVIFNGGSIGLWLDSQAAGVNGSLSLHARACTFWGQATRGIISDPYNTNLVENIHIDGCEFFLQGGTSIYITGADAIWINGCRFERVVLVSASPHIYIDTTFGVKITDNYIEDGNNVFLISVGADISSINISDNYLSVAVNGNHDGAGSAVLGAGALNVGVAIDQLKFNGNYILVNGTCTTLFSATATNLDRHGNTIRVNSGFTVTNGWQDGGLVASMASYGNSFLSAGATLTNPVTYAEPVFFGFTYP